MYSFASVEKLQDFMIDNVVDLDDRWITQTNLHDPSNGVVGNCTQAAIASYLGLPLDQVPDFNDIHKDEPHAGQFWRHIDHFFAAHGYELMLKPKTFRPRGTFLASGPSERGFKHMVVMRDDRLLHDPHPSRAGLASIDHIWVAVPLDPALHTLNEI